MKEVYAIICTLPSGKKYAWSGVKGEFALVPLSADGSFKGAFYWETEDKAEEHLLAQMKVAPKLRKLGPFKIEKLWVKA
jgi:hypothetical protein